MAQPAETWSTLLDTTNLSSILESLQHFNISLLYQPILESFAGVSHPKTTQDWQSIIYETLSALLQRHTTEISSALLAVVAFIFVLASRSRNTMSWLKFGGLDRFSPFTRSPPQGSATVNDADFSYITNDDLKKHVAESETTGTERDTDVIILRDRKNEYEVHAPAHSIANGDLRVRTLRDAAAQKMGIPPSKVKILYKGRVLKNDNLQCRAEGLRSGSEILCSNEDSEFLSEIDDDDSKKKRNRSNRNKKRRGKQDGEDEDQLNVPPTQSRGVSPGVSTGTSTPLTAKEKIAALRAVLDSYDQEVQAFLKSPPSDHAKREFDRKRISETLLTQILLKTDAIETEGDSTARMARKELVKDTQDMLKRLDEAHGGQTA